MLDSEVARLAGLDRQLVRHWAMRAGINVSKRRAARLRETWRSKLGKLGTFRNFAGQSRKGGGEGQGRRPLSCDIRKVIFIGNAGNDQLLGQLLWTGVVPNQPSTPTLARLWFSL